VFIVISSVPVQFVSGMISSGIKMSSDWALVSNFRFTLF